MNIKIPKYDGHSIKLAWESGFSIQCSVEDSIIVLSANSAGLISLAKHLLTLAQNEVPQNTHIHLDEYNSLEEGSQEIIVIKK